MPAVKLVVTVPWGARLGGAEVMLWGFLSNVDRSQVDPTVVFFEPGPFQRDVAALGMHTFVVPTGRLRDARRVARAVQVLTHVFRAQSPDLIVNWIGKAQLYGAVAALRAGAADRVIWWQHGISRGQWMDRVATLLPTRAVGCSSTSAEAAQRRLRPRRRTFVVHPGVELVSEAHAASAGSGIRVPEAPTTLGIVGRLQPMKGQDLFLRTLAHLVCRGNNVHGLIVGGEAHGLSAGYRDHLEQLVKQLGLGERVTMTGQVSDPSPYLDAMDVLVNPCRSEAFGIALLEAMAHRVPVVAVASGGPSDIVTPDVSGILVDSPEPEALATAIEPLVSDRALRRRIGEAGRERVSERFTTTGMTRALERNFRELAAEVSSAQEVTSSGAPRREAFESRR